MHAGQPQALSQPSPPLFFLVLFHIWFPVFSLLFAFQVHVTNTRFLKAHVIIIFLFHLINILLLPPHYVPVCVFLLLVVLQSPLNSGLKTVWHSQRGIKKDLFCPWSRHVTPLNVRAQTGVNQDWIHWCQWAWTGRTSIKAMAKQILLYWSWVKSQQQPPQLPSVLSLPAQLH